MISRHHVWICKLWLHSYTAYIVGLCVLSLLDQDIREKHDREIGVWQVFIVYEP